MIFLDFYRFSCVSFSIIMIVILSFLLADLFQKKHKYYKALAWPIILAIYSTVIYSIFFITKIILWQFFLKLCIL